VVEQGDMEISGVGQGTSSAVGQGSGPNLSGGWSTPYAGRAFKKGCRQMSVPVC